MVHCFQEFKVQSLFSMKIIVTVFYLLVLLLFVRTADDTVHSCFNVFNIFSERHTQIKNDKPLLVTTKLHRQFKQRRI